MLSDIVEQLVFPIAERGLADPQFGSDLALGEAVCDQTEDLTTVRHDAVQVLQQTGQHKLVHNAVFKWGALIRDVKPKAAILSMVAFCVDDAVDIKDIAWNLVDAVAAVAIALGEVVVAAAVISPGTITFVRYPAGVIKIGFFRYRDQLLADGDVTLLLICHENRLLSNSRRIRRSRSIR